MREYVVIYFIMVVFSSWLINYPFLSTSMEALVSFLLLSVSLGSYAFSAFLTFFLYPLWRCQQTILLFSFCVSYVFTPIWWADLISENTFQCAHSEGDPCQDKLLVTLKGKSTFFPGLLKMFIGINHSVAKFNIAVTGAAWFLIEVTCQHTIQMKQIEILVLNTNKRDMLYLVDQPLFSCFI